MGVTYSTDVCNSCCSKRDDAQYGIEPNTIKRIKHQHLIHNFSDGDVDKINSIMHQHPSIDFLHQAVEGNDSCLHLAVKYQQHNAIHYLLQQGVDINVQNPYDGDTAFHIAARVGDARILRIFADYKADPYIANDNGEMVNDLILHDMEIDFYVSQWLN